MFCSAGVFVLFSWSSPPRPSTSSPSSLLSLCVCVCVCVTPPPFLPVCLSEGVVQARTSSWIGCNRHPLSHLCLHCRRQVSSVRSCQHAAEITHEQRFDSNVQNAHLPDIGMTSQASKQEEGDTKQGGRAIHLPEGECQRGPEHAIIVDYRPPLLIWHRGREASRLRTTLNWRKKANG